MKHFIRSILAVAAIVFCAACFSSCNKDNSLAPNTNNPVEVSLPSASFELVVLDQERGYSRDSNYVFEGVWRDGHFWFGRERLDTMQLNIHPGNGIVLKVNSDDAAFQGVNASSSSRCIDIVPDGNDHTQYHLEWVAEGEARIALWCGEGASRKEIRFVATSKKEIPLEGIRFRVNGEEGIAATNFANPIWYHRTQKPNSTEEGPVTMTAAEWNGAVKTFNASSKQFLPDKRSTGTVKLEIIGPIPLNATPTTKLQIALDNIGMADHYANIPPAKLFTGEPRWCKYYGLYEENFHCIPDFRWFNPLILDEDCLSVGKDGWWNRLCGGDDRVCFDYRDGLRLWSKYVDNEKYSLYPADLRERYAEVWPQNRCSIFYVGFTTGEMKEAEQYPGPAINTSGTLYSLSVVFNNTQDVMPFVKSEHGYWEP